MFTAKTKTLRITTATTLLALALVVALTGCANRELSDERAKPDGSQPRREAVVGGLTIPIADITEKAAFYSVDVDGTKMEVIAVKAPDGSIRTAFNTCEVCYDSGRGYYKQEDDVLVCQNCGNRFQTSQIETQAQGCNPWPIFADDKTVTEENVVISQEFLKEAKGIFANWGKSY
ncbi:MAG: DUF2318 domain-containing protein [Clostridiales Family XIII bacterium]|jgi:uncharacterized membrane protein|nr:DUF2318 domain-containing protein [Clostridiales Family XIII bacterium]